MQFGDGYYSFVTENILLLKVLHIQRVSANSLFTHYHLRAVYPRFHKREYGEMFMAIKFRVQEVQLPAFD
jgi:hypothetical protein